MKNQKGRGKSKPRPIPDVLTEEERTLLLQAFTGTSPSKRRNLLMVRLMLNAGLRSAEVVSLLWDDLYLNSGQIKVRQGKGGRDRILWLNQEDADMFRGYCPSKKWLQQSRLVFQTKTGKPVSTRFLRKMMERACKRVGLRPISPHLLRHTFATDLLRLTKNLKTVRDALGHANISTTLLYTRIINEELEWAMKNLRNGTPY